MGVKHSSKRKEPGHKDSIFHARGSKEVTFFQDTGWVLSGWLNHRPKNLVFVIFVIQCALSQNLLRGQKNVFQLITKGLQFRGRYPSLPAPPLAVWDDVHLTSLQNGHTSQDMKIKIMLIGDGGVAKSSILSRFYDDVFKPSISATIGIDFAVKNIHRQCMSGTKVFNLQIWDLAGQKRFRTIIKQHFKKADAIAICYDITRYSSFISVDGWFRDVQLHNKKNYSLLLVGNKVDLSGIRTVTVQEGLAKAQELGCPFIETSAKTGQNVCEAFDLLACMSAQIKSAVS